MKVRVLIGLVALLAGALTLGVVASAGATGDSPEKAAFMQQQAKERAAAEAGPRAPKVHIRPVSVGLPVRQGGVLNVRQGPVPAGQFVARNSWQGPVGGAGSTWFVVWAGATGTLSAVPGTPGVIVRLQAPTPDGTSFTDNVVGTFTDSSADGPLSVVAVNGAVVELVSSGGHTYTFNLETKSFS